MSAGALRDEELGEEQVECSATEIPATKKEIEAAKRELRFVRRNTVNKLRQTMKKLKRFLEFRGSRTVMRLLLEQLFETREEMRTINYRFFARLEAAEQQIEQTAAERFKNEVEELRQGIKEHLKETINEPPSTIASIPLSLRKVSAPKGSQFGKLATSTDMNINQADIETTKRRHNKTRRQYKKGKRQFFPRNWKEKNSRRSYSRKNRNLNAKSSKLHWNMRNVGGVEDRRIGQAPSSRKDRRLRASSVAISWQPATWEMI